MRNSTVSSPEASERSPGSARHRLRWFGPASPDSPLCASYRCSGPSSTRFMVGSFECLWRSNSSRFNVPPTVSMSAARTSVVMRTISPLGAVAVAASPGGTVVSPGADGFAGAATPFSVPGAAGGGLGRLWRSQASQSMRSEKLKMKSRISLCVSMYWWGRAQGTGSKPPRFHGPQRHTRRTASHPPRKAP